METKKTLTFETASRRRSGARRATRARRGDGRAAGCRRARARLCAFALDARAGGARTTRTRNRRGGGWGRCGRTRWRGQPRWRSVFRDFPGPESREPSSSERSSERLPGKRFRENPLFAMTGLKNKRRNGPPHRRRRGGHPRGGARGHAEGAAGAAPRAGRRRRRDPFFFATGKPSRELGVIADDAPGVRFFFPRPVPVARLGRLSIGAVVHAQLSERLARALGGGVAGEGADSAAGPRRDATGRGRAVPRGDRRGGGAPRSARARRRRARGERRNVVVGVVVALAGEAERRARGRRRGRVAGPTAEFERDAGDARALRYKVREGRARAYELLRRVYYHSRRGVRVSVSAVFDTSQNFILHVWQKSVTFKTCAATEKASADDACVRPLGGAPSPQRRRSISIRDRTRAHHTLASRRAIARVSR